MCLRPQRRRFECCSAQAKSVPVLHRLARIQHHAFQRAATLRSVSAQHVAAHAGVDQDRVTAICRPAQRECARELSVAMPDKPEDVRIEVAHELFDSIERGPLAEVGVGGQHAGIKHLLCLSPVRELLSNGRAAEDRGESPTIPQLAGGELWLGVGVGHRAQLHPTQRSRGFLLHALSAHCTLRRQYEK